MRVMITGAHGLLGQKTALVFAQESAHELLLTDLAAETFFANPRFAYEQLDITRRGDVKSLVTQWRPDLIIHTAAFTDVDACETDREYAWRVNVDGVKNLLVPARQRPGCRLIHLSTDYVFDGRAAAYDETSRPNPAGYYGKSKLAAENAVTLSGVPAAIVRTQVLYGTGYQVRQNFVSWVLSMCEKKQPFRVVDDQTGSPTFADDLAYALLIIAERGATGLYHVSGPESIDRYRFALKIAAEFGFANARIAPMKTIDLGQIAHRPERSTFVTLKFESEFGFRLCDTDTGLRRMHQQYRDGATHVDLLNQITAPRPGGRTD